MSKKSDISRNDMISSINSIFNNPIIQEMSRRLKKYSIDNNENKYSPSYYKYIFIEELYKVNDSIDNDIINFLNINKNFNRLMLKLSEKKVDKFDFVKMIRKSKFINMLRKEYLLNDIQSIFEYVMEEMYNEIIEQI